MRISEKAWCGVALGILGYDMTCPPGETLSEGAYDHRVLTLALGGLILGHLTKAIPQRYDLIHQTVTVLRLNRS